ncbi:MAG: acetylornithine deacetylase [Henriciella sp.]|nr:acetylornithine deacetylase [Henriciella sp.]
MSTYPIVRDQLAQLIAFDTTSRLSNLALIDWVEAQLEPLGAVCRRIPNAEGTKANLWVRIGPDTPGGIVLSGHTDVVPVDGQDWHTDPFTLTEHDGLLYGRGTSDMKGFVALCLAFAPEFAKLNLSKPIHFAFSYDEEVGCQGAPEMIAQIIAHGARPDAVWVGEPSLWQAVSGHKGITVTEVDVHGREAHSSLPDLGISANGVAIDLMMVLRQIEKDLITCGPKDSPFEPPYPTLTIGEMRGGTAHNILARHCHFGFDLRCPPGFDPDAILAPFYEAAEQADAEMKARFPECGVEVNRISNVPPLAPDPDNAAEILVRALTGDNAMRAVAYATEAGQFHQAGLSAVICGPGSIDQAHKPNEFIDPAQLQQGVTIFKKLVDRLSAGS